MVCTVPKECGRREQTSTIAADRWNGSEDIFVHSSCMFACPSWNSCNSHHLHHAGSPPYCLSAPFCTIHSCICQGPMRKRRAAFCNRLKQGNLRWRRNKTIRLLAKTTFQGRRAWASNVASGMTCRPLILKVGMTRHLLRASWPFVCGRGESSRMNGKLSEQSLDCLMVLRGDDEANGSQTGMIAKIRLTSPPHTLPCLTTLDNGKTPPCLPTFHCMTTENAVDRRICAAELLWIRSLPFSFESKGEVDDPLPPES